MIRLNLCVDPDYLLADISTSSPREDYRYVSARALRRLRQHTLIYASLFEGVTYRIDQSSVVDSPALIRLSQTVFVSGCRWINEIYF